MVESGRDLTADIILGLLTGATFIYLLMQVQQLRRRSKFKRNDLGDTKNQLRFVEEIELFAERPINKEAFRIFRALEDHLESRKPKLRLLAEVGLGAFIRTSRNNSPQWKRQRAFSSFNSKRVDFLIIDHFGRPAVAVEYQGTGHYLGENAAGRDVVKKRALQRAGIELLEIHTTSSTGEFLAQLDQMLARHLRKHAN